MISDIISLAVFDRYPYLGGTFTMDINVVTTLRDPVRMPCGVYDLILPQGIFPVYAATFPDSHPVCGC